MVFLSLLPKELEINEKIIRLDYKSMDDCSQKKIMIILTDITEKKELEVKMEEERNNIKLIVKVISNRTDLNMALQDFEIFFEKQCYQIIQGNNEKKDIKAILIEIFRIIHTYKGDFGHLGMYNTGKNLHILENTIAKMLEDIVSITISDINRFFREIDYNKIIEQDMTIISEIMGESYIKTSESFSVSLEKIIEIEEKIKNSFTGAKSEELLMMITHLKFHNVKDILVPYNDSVRYLAHRYDKDIKDIVVLGDDIYIEKSKYSKVLKSLVHIFRNSIDHGIEYHEERIMKGKSEFGSIECRVEVCGKNSFKFFVRDDGDGISSEAVLKKAIELGLLKQNEVNGISKNKVMAFIFTDEFSTKDSVSMVSGRGLGLVAVKAEIEKLGGSVYVDTEMGKYTEFVIELPVL